MNWFAIFGVLFLTLTAYGTLRQTWIARMRKGQGFEDYLASFNGTDVPLEIHRSVYGFLQKGLWVKFSVRAEDSLEDVYGIVGEDLDDSVEAIASRCGRSVSQNGSRIVTVRDLALLIAGLPEVKT